MKALTILLLVVLSTSINKCSSEELKSLKRDMVIEYEAKTRGSISKLIVRKDSLIVMEEFRNEGVYYYPLASKDWDNIVKEAQKIDPEKVKSYKAPSKKRDVDAARAAQIKVIHNDKIYDSNVFDEGNPPAELKALVDKVADLYINHKRKIIKNDD